jgi:uncharacterized membrane protein HdeD (DUF308 family)
MLKSLSIALIVRGLLALVVGALVLAWPVPTALIFALLVASWAIVTGRLEIVAAFRSDEEARTRAMFIIGGLVSVAFGVVLFARPGMGESGSTDLSPLGTPSAGLVEKQDA